jgi:hypothetical protein
MMTMSDTPIMPGLPASATGGETADEDQYYIEASGPKLRLMNWAAEGGISGCSVFDTFGPMIIEGESDDSA